MIRAISVDDDSRAHQALAPHGGAVPLPAPADTPAIDGVAHCEHLLVIVRQQRGARGLDAGHI